MGAEIQDMHLIHYNRRTVFDVSVGFVPFKNSLSNLKIATLAPPLQCN